MTLPALHVILDLDVSAAHGWTVPALARACLDGGARLLQVRAKRCPSRALLEMCDAVVALASTAGALVIVNDRPDIARLAAAAGVHVGQDDLSPSQARLLVGETAIVGRSTHTEPLVRLALEEPTTYVAVGPVHATRTKETGCEPLGLAFVRRAGEIAGAHARPRGIVAIGGITLDGAAAVLDAGAAGVAVISDLFTGGDPEVRTRAFIDALR